MHKEELDKLDILSQVEYINSLLSNGTSLVSIGVSLGINESSIRKRFKKNGYTRIGNKFVLTVNPLKQECTRDITHKVTHPIPIEHEDNLIAILSLIEKNTFEIEELREEIKILKDSGHTINPLPPTPHVIEFEGIAKGRTIKAYDIAMNKLDDFIKAYPSLLKQDIISTAIMEYISKYDTSKKLD